MRPSSPSMSASSAPVVGVGAGPVGTLRHRHLVVVAALDGDDVASRVARHPRLDRVVVDLLVEQHVADPRVDPLRGHELGRRQRAHLGVGHQPERRRGSPRCARRSAGGARSRRGAPPRNRQPVTGRGRHAVGRIGRPARRDLVAALAPGPGVRAHPGGETEGGGAGGERRPPVGSGARQRRWRDVDHGTAADDRAADGDPLVRASTGRSRPGTHRRRRRARSPRTRPRHRRCRAGPRARSR